jgi:hypothetical protein
LIIQRNHKVLFATFLFVEVFLNAAGAIGEELSKQSLILECTVNHETVGTATYIVELNLAQKNWRMFGTMPGSPSTMDTGRILSYDQSNIILLDRDESVSFAKKYHKFIKIDRILGELIFSVKGIGNSGKKIDDSDRGKCMRSEKSIPAGKF